MPQRDYAACRAKGLCVECKGPSVKYSRCLDCRRARRPLQATYEQRYYRKNKPKRMAAQRIRDRRTRQPRIAFEWFDAA